MHASEYSAVSSQLARGSDPAAPHRIAFLHGLFGRGRNFQSIATALAPEAQSLLVDLPNHGGSAWTEHFDYVSIADLVAQHLRADFAAAAPVDIVGHSMGGKVAMVLALRHPDLVRRLVVVDIAPVPSPREQGNFDHLLASLRELDLSRLERRGDADAALQAAIPQAGVRGFLLQNLTRTQGGFAWQPNLEMLHGELDAVMGFPDLSGQEFRSPVLWLRGEASDYVADAAMATMATLFPEVVLETITGAGHWVHAEQPEAFTRRVRAFLR